MSQLFFWCYPWDLEDEGFDAALGSLAGEIGVDAVSIYATCQDIRQIRPRAPAEQRMFCCGAAAHFQPVAASYAHGGIRPHPATWLKSRNPLERIAAAAERHKLGLRIRADCCHGAALAQRHPHAACVNVFGDRRDDRLCPSQPEVREYVSNLVADLAGHYPAETIELEAVDFGPPVRADGYSDASLAFDDAAGRLLSWCFCSACRTRSLEAGVDAEEARLAIIRHLEACMRPGRPRAASLEELVAAEPVLAEYRRMRVEAVASLLLVVRPRSNCRLLLHYPVEAMPGTADAAALGAQCDGFILPFEGGEPSRSAREVAAAAGGLDRIEASMRCYPPLVEDGPTLVSNVHQITQAPYAAVGFENYGTAPAECLEWVRQAVRYARRESTT